MSASNHSADVEKDAAGQAYAHLTNETVHSFSWKDVTVTVNDRATKQPLDILSGINGVVQAGEMLALMGPRYTTTSYLTWSCSKLTFNAVALAKQRFSTFSRTVLQLRSRQCSRSSISMDRRQT
jgi:hypothetical protein